MCKTENGNPTTEGMIMAARRIMTLHGRRLREELLALRQSRGLKLADVVELAENDFTDTTLSRWETGENLPKPTDLRRLLEVYEVSGEKKRELLTLLKDARENRRSWWAPARKSLKKGFADYLSLERDAQAIRTYQVALIPGLLQTRDYASAMTKQSVVVDSGNVDQIVDVRMSRQDRLTEQEKPLDYFAIVDEAVVRRQVGGLNVMRAQLDHLLDAMKLGNVQLRVLPFSAGAHAAMEGPFSLMEFPEPHPTVVYVENTTRGLASDEESDVQPYSMVWGSLNATALDTDETAEFLAQVRDET